MMKGKIQTSQTMAAAITKAASLQTYMTIRLLVDRDLVEHAYRAYAYFRWVDDAIDDQAVLQRAPGQGDSSWEIAFVNRQKDLLHACCQGEPLEDLCIEEQMLVDLVRSDSGKDLRLHSYLHNMMGVMEFDARRRGRLVSQVELAEYSRMLASAVTDALYYFIGHDEPAPRHQARYLAVTGAHITHMLRDTLEDIQAGYINIPGEYLQASGIAPGEVDSRAYRAWVCERAGLARIYFRAGRAYLAQDKCLRRRLAGYAYTARFTWMLRVLERDNYCLRSEYRQRKSLPAGLWMGWSVLSSLVVSIWRRAKPPIRQVEAPGA